MAHKDAISFDISMNKSFNKQLELLRQWPARLKKIQPMIAYMGAEYIQRFVKSKLPKTAAFKGYRAGLEVVRVRGTGPGQYAYSVQIDPTNHFVKNVKVKAVLIYVHPAKRLSTPSPRIAILEKFNPWTYDTLPFTPDPKEGIMVTKRARPQEVHKVANLRSKQRSQWARLLQRQGVKPQGRDQRLKLPKSVTSLPDVALDGLKLEFGLGNQKPKPAWRLGFSHLARQGFKAFMKDKRVFAFPLTRPSFTLWKKWPRKTAHSISVAQATKFKAFQRKVALRS